MIYYYAHSGHKFGLECVRRATALINELKKEGIEVELLVNDFRAGLAARELGVAGSVTIETVLDVDAVAKRGDSVILDTPEDLTSCLERYADGFKPLFCVTDHCATPSRYGEIYLSPSCQEEENCKETPMIDSEYFDALPKEDRTVFFLGDADYDKIILSHQDFFDGLELDLILGHYFFVKYEDELSKIFHHLHEAEEYSTLVRSSKRVITRSSQCALESKAAGADVIYMKKPDDSACLIKQLASCGVKIIDNFDKQALLLLLDISQSGQKRVNQINILSKSLIQRLNL